jgi:predicted dehydrogenase
VAHGAVLARDPGVELVGVYGRDGEKAATLAAELGVAPYTEFDAMLADVDAVAFAVPPDVQAEHAIRAAEAGKHLLLDKPVATSLDLAERLERAVERAQVCSVVFFTMRFEPESRAWLSSVEGESWQGAWARWIVSAFAPGSPYAQSSWRLEKGALWDVGPHALSVLLPTLGPVIEVSADAGEEDLVHLVFHHESGATSTASLTLRAPQPAINVEVSLWGPSGTSTLPGERSGAEVAYEVALHELLAQVKSGSRSHPCDVHFGTEVVRILARAERQITARAHPSPAS